MSDRPWRAWSQWAGRRSVEPTVFTVHVQRDTKESGALTYGDWQWAAEDGDRLSGSHANPCPQLLRRMWDQRESLIVLTDALPALLWLYPFRGYWQRCGWEMAWWVLRDPPVQITMRRGQQRCHIVSAPTLLPRWRARPPYRHDATGLLADVLAWRDTLSANGLAPLRPTMSALARQSLSACRGPDTLLRGKAGVWHDLAGECSLTGFLALPSGPGTYPDCVALDIRGAYRRIMERDDLPCGPSSTGRAPSVRRLHTLATTVPTIARVTVHDAHGRIPRPRPQRTKWTPWRGTTTLAGPELVRALELDAVTHCHHACTYIPGAPTRNLAQRLDAIRTVHSRAGWDNGGALIKALTTRLYGVLAQPKRQWEPVGECDPSIFAQWSEYSYGSHERHDYRAYEGVVERDTPNGWPPLAAPWLSAHIASQCRVWLMELIGAAAGGCRYADTDCLIVTRKAAPLVYSWAAAKGEYELHIEAEGDLVLRKPKIYTIGDKISHAGYQHDGSLNIDRLTIERQPSASLILK